MSTVKRVGVIIIILLVITSRWRMDGHTLVCRRTYSQIDLIMVYGNEAASHHKKRLADGTAYNSTKNILVLWGYITLAISVLVFRCNKSSITSFDNLRTRSERVDRSPRSKLANRQYDITLTIFMCRDLQIHKNSTDSQAMQVIALL